MTTTRNDLEIRNLIADVFKRGGEFRAEEPAATRRRPGFSAFVLWPALVFGGVTLVGSFGLITVIFAAGVKSGAWGEWGYWRLALGLSAFVAAIVSGWVLVMLTSDWRDLQWQYRKLEIEADPPKVLQNDRQIERVDDSHLIGLRAPWATGWQTLLANSVFNRRGEWTGGKTIARDRHLEGLYTDLTGNYETALDDLVRLGWLRDKAWTDKAKEELKKRLPVAAPTPNGGG